MKKRAPGRPKNGKKRRAHLAVYLEAEECELIALAAEVEHMSASAWAGRAIRKALEVSRG